jgi:hypothetical protein
MVLPNLVEIINWFQIDTLKNILTTKVRYKESHDNIVLFRGRFSKIIFGSKFILEVTFSIDSQDKLFRKYYILDLLSRKDIENELILIPNIKENIIQSYIEKYFDKTILFHKEVSISEELFHRW